MSQAGWLAQAGAESKGKECPPLQYGVFGWHADALQSVMPCQY